MRLNVVSAALARPAKAALAATATIAAMSVPALAGDRALANFIGYSEDGKYFAFEEYGVQDGSGFAYSNVYVVDLTKDAWAAGSPFREMAGDETASLPDIRAKAAADAADTLEKLGIDRPAQILALVGDGINDAGAASLELGNPDYTSPGSTLDSFSVALTTFDAESAQPCTDYLGEPAKGFALTFGAGKATAEVHRDKALPESRGCPLTYRLYAVVAPYDAALPDDAVAIVSAYPFGFEGPDRRFIAVPLAGK